MHDRLLGPHQGLIGALNQVLPRLGEHLNGHTLGDEVVLDEAPDKIKIGLRG